MVRRRRSDEDFSEEVRAHLELESARLQDEGLAPDAARAAAIKAFGNVLGARERFHEANRWVLGEQFLQDLRYAARGMAKSPTFVATAVLTLAVGLGLLTVAFTVFNAYVLRPFAVKDPSSLYRVGWRAHDDGGQAFTWKDYDELRARTDLFDAVVGESSRFISSDGRTLAATFVSDNYFAALAPRLLAGRGLGPADAQQPVAVLGHQAWARLFAADPAAVGREIDLDGHPYLIVGVLRAEFGGLDDSPKDVWLPATRDDPRPRIEIVARLRGGVPPGRAEAALAGFMSRMAPANIAPGDVRASLLPNATANPLSFTLLAILSPVFAAFGLVLLTACANVSNVMLARAVARHREIAVRLSLGASRARIVRQLLTEGLLVALLAGAAAVTLAAWILRAAAVALFSTLPPSLAALLRVAPLPLDFRVFLFALTVATVATAAFALLPALQASRQPLTDALRGQRSGTPGASRMRSALVVAQVAMSVLLVVCALVLARNFTSVGALDLGYDTTGVYSINVRGEAAGLIQRTAEALAADPRTGTVAVTGGNPLFVTRTLAARPHAASAAVPTRYTFVSPEFFTVLRLPVTHGRAFRDDEARSAARVAIVSEATAHAFWPGASAIGQTIRIDRPDGRRVDELPGYTEVAVVGVVRDVVSGIMLEGRDTGHVYLPASAADPHASALLVRPPNGSGFRPDMARETFRRLGYDPETFEVIPLGEMRDAQMYPLRAAAWIGGLLGAIALVLSISGLYGVLSYMLSQRSREIGIRMALGATAGTVLALVMRQSARLAGVGVMVGVAVSLAALKLLASLVRLREVAFFDGPAFAGAVALVAAATALAAYQPARRATRIDPAETLRAEA